MPPGSDDSQRVVWDAIAASFSQTRRKPWPAVVEFLGALPRGSLILDAGTGNGRHAEAAAALGHRVVGLDFSRALLGHARRRVAGGAWVLGRLEHLPLQPTRFDAVLLVATLHHVRGQAARRGVLEHVWAALRPRGELLISVWSRHAPAFENAANPLRPPQEGPVEAGDAILRWTQHGLDEERFVHLYDWPGFEEELRALPIQPRRVWRDPTGARARPENFYAHVVK